MNQLQIDRPVGLRGERNSKEKTGARVDRNQGQRQGDPHGPRPRE